MQASEFTLVVMDHVGILVLLDAEHRVGVGVFGLFIPNQAFSFDTNDCRARVLILSSFRSGRFTCGAGIENECYLVDPASSHMLVSKIKPCMCKYELIQTVKLRMAH